MRRSPLLLAAALAAAVVLPAVPAAAAPHAPVAGCFSSGCTGKDPAKHCQGDAETVDSLRLPTATLELRYSPSCEAVWARLSGPWPVGAKGAPQARVIRNQDGRTYTCTYARRDQRLCWTRMLNERGFQSYAFAEYDTGMGVQRARTGAY